MFEEEIEFTPVVFIIEPNEEYSYCEDCEYAEMCNGDCWEV